jgi:hypothetical protein
MFTQTLCFFNPMADPTGFHSDSTDDSYEDLGLDTFDASGARPLSDTDPMEDLKTLADHFAQLSLKHIGTDQEDDYSRIAEGVAKALMIAQQCAKTEDEELKTRFRNEATQVCTLMQGDHKVQMQQIAAAF